MENERKVELRGAGRVLPAAVGATAAAAVVGVFAGAGNPGGPLAVAVAGLLVVAWGELPRRVAFDVDGVERRSRFRRHRIPWGDVDSLERLPTRLGFDTLADRPPGGRGLAVRTVRGSLYVLSVTTESPEEHRALQRAVAQWAPYCRMNLLR